jgi:uncharacterized protein (TIGR00730 family)
MSALGKEWGDLLADLEKGFALLRDLPPAVTFFGGARITEDDPFWDQSRELGALLAAAGIPPRTGAGPGIMTSVPEGYKAASADSWQGGAFATAVSKGYGAAACAIAAPPTQGIKIYLPFEPETNEAIDRSVELVTFPIRRLMLYENSLALVVFPGGIGTLDELFEVWARRGGKFRDPIILFGTSFFGPIIDALRIALCDGSRKLMTEEEFRVQLTDDPQAVVDGLVKAEGLVGFDEEPEVLARRLAEEIPYVAGALRMADEAITVLGGDVLADDDPTLDVARGVLSSLAAERSVRIGAGGALANLALSVFKEQGRVADLQGFFLADQGPASDEWDEAMRLEVCDPLAHKLLLTQNTAGFLALPGAMRTLDEVFSVLCEMQTGKREEAPIVLVGSDYWQPIIDACETVMFSDERKTISADDFRRLTVVDGAKEALAALAPSSLGGDRRVRG